MSASTRSTLWAVLLLVCGFAWPAHAARPPRLFVAAFGLFSDQGVFLREATQAAQIVAQRFGAVATVVRANTRTRSDATEAGIASTLDGMAKSMDREHDILFVILTSHGSRDGLSVVTRRSDGIMSPKALAAILDRTRVRHKVVVISACYSGVFVPSLARPATLVITAADADHTSFGCADEAKWTYFGNAFFDTALRRAGTLVEAFGIARTIVRARELKEGFTPSNPQIAGGGEVAPLLVARASTPPSATRPLKLAIPR